MKIKRKRLKDILFSNGIEIPKELATEVWDFETGNNWIFEPSLLPNGHVDGMALYFVDANFCKFPDYDDDYESCERPC